MATYLDEIVAVHRERAKKQRYSVHELKGYALDEGPVRPFGQALVASDGLAVIAEVKRRSPSKGKLASDLDVRQLAADYQSGGATCVSVLTDKQFFGGSRRDLGDVRQGCTLPVLRKDFTVCEEDVCEARWFGADAVLLIVAILDDHELRAFHDLASWLGIDALVEVHDEAELERALAVGAALVGVNQRDLVTFEVDTQRAVRMAEAIPDGVVKVAESGIAGPADAARLHEAGYDAILVGESLVTSPDPTAAVRALRSAPCP
ncbi:MAG TPA: indole-3-glycerol phosphate synthase TrpC [Acidimicrobiales bacterium]|nr:indole-3-glycerol phosphate synthase TrpC [Acidimicrobiales bacterium]